MPPITCTTSGLLHSVLTSVEHLTVWELSGIRRLGENLLIETGAGFCGWAWVSARLMEWKNSWNWVAGVKEE